ncbi:MAG: GNAT family N-acetyltransferase [Ruminococcaceae bacterium]|nr:GNAT family N-acetyltransferase [Oscillospiraceae bacterium]
MTFRKIKAGDKSLYLDMARDFYHSPAVLHPVPDSYIENTFDLVLNGTPFADIYIFEDDDGVQGYAVLAFTHSQEAGGLVCWIEELYLRPCARGKGAGGAFLDHICREVPAARFRLEVEPDNLRVKSLYARHGFLPMGYQSYVLEKN